jgi:hypothetical protein
MLLDREGRRAAIIRQCDDQYRVTRPHCRPYTPRESWVGAKRRAVQLAMAVLDRAPGQPSSWSENERHTVPPGMTPRQYQETCRDRRRRHPNWSDDQIAAHTKHALQPNEHLAPMLPVQPVPFTKTADVDAAPLINSIPEDVSIRRPCGPRSHDRGAAA